MTTAQRGIRRDLLHPYHLDIPFSQSGIPLRGALRYYREIRALMDLNGDEDLKACISKYGIPTTNIGRVLDEAYKPNSSRTC